jgi:hypothetical protein
LCFGMAGDHRITRGAKPDSDNMRCFLSPPLQPAAQGWRKLCVDEELHSAASTTG